MLLVGRVQHVLGPILLCESEKLVGEMKFLFFQNLIIVNMHPVKMSVTGDGFACTCSTGYVDYGFGSGCVGRPLLCAMCVTQVIIIFMAGCCPCHTKVRFGS